MDQFTLGDILGHNFDPDHVPLPEEFRKALADRFHGHLSDADLAWLVSLYERSLASSVREFVRHLNGDGLASVPCRFTIQTLLDEISRLAVRHDEVDFAVTQLRIAMAELENPELRPDPPEPADFAE